MVTHDEVHKGVVAVYDDLLGRWETSDSEGGPIPNQG